MENSLQNVIFNTNYTSVPPNGGFVVSPEAPAQASKSTSSAASQQAVAAAGTT